MEQRTEDRGQMKKDRGQRAEGGSGNAEVGKQRQRAEVKKVRKSS
jgi:hypothetical protein